MGRSTASCFKIITCAGDSADKDEDDLLPPENKSSSDKRGWSFRKRSARHRVLSNTVVAEAPYSANKESSESANINFQSPDTSSIPEKISVIQCTDDKPQLPIADSKVSETIVVTKDESEVHAQLEESVVVVIQTGVRGFLAQKELFKLRILVKLQAAVRGHLVRQHAVGTLRCVQAIVKMQALVRARRARLLQQGSSTANKIDGKCDKAISETSESSITKPNVTYTSIEKLLSNRFARQLMESTPKERPIHIKCDPSKPNSAWNWLERWMSVSSAEPTPKPELTNEELERERKTHLASLLETAVPSEGSCELGDSKSNLEETVPPSETKENLITYAVDDFKFQECHPTSPLVEEDLEQVQSEKINKSDAKEPSGDINPLPSKTVLSDVNSQVHVKLEQLQSEKISKSDVKEPSGDINPLPSETVLSDVNSQVHVKVEPSVEINSFPSQTVESDVNSQMQINVFSQAETGGEQIDQPKRSMKRSASEQLETEGKKFVYGSRKASNVAFIAAHSKFEELSATTNSNRSVSSSYQDSEVELNLDTASSGPNTVTRTRELDMVEDSIANNTKAHYGGSECGTELSITSTLDSPDRSEVGAADNENEEKSSEKETCNPNNTKDADIEVMDDSTNRLSKLSDSVVIQPQKLDIVRAESVASIPVADSQNIELKPERSVCDIQVERDLETGGPAYRSSPEASPRSHVTVPESQGTPSSQLSVKSKTNKTEKNSSNQKRKFLSAGKRSPSNSNVDSGARSSMEHLSKDQKNGKRRNSFGSTRTEQTDQEPRDSSTSSSLPHFMQATESARAKIQANNSPRSSPDVQDRDYIKKRHSLPGANGRQGSPRVQRSMSQAQPGAKGNESHVIHEKKWQR